MRWIVFLDSSDPAVKADCDARGIAYALEDAGFSDVRTFGHMNFVLGSSDTAEHVRSKVRSELANTFNADFHPLVISASDLGMMIAPVHQDDSRTILVFLNRPEAVAGFVPPSGAAPLGNGCYLVSRSDASLFTKASVSTVKRNLNTLRRLLQLVRGPPLGFLK